jgi:nucleotide-binding universal stress UspA family protein
MKRILLAYDGAEPARKALGLAADLARTYEATVTVVSVVPMHPGRAPIDPWDDPEVHLAQLREAAVALREQGIEPELVEPAGDPATMIERVAEQGKFDLIVVGTSGTGVVGRILQGSVSEHVVKHAPVSVVVAR